MRRALIVAAVLAGSPAAFADRGDGTALASVVEDTSPLVTTNGRGPMHDLMVYEPGAASVVERPGAIGTRILYLNDCKPNGCQVRSGGTDSRSDRSSIASTGVLTAFKYDDVTWNHIVTCVRDVMSPFNLQVTTTDPGTTPHFEVMIAGEGTAIGMDANTLGVSPYACNPNSNNNPTGLYIDNTLVFAFANMAYYATVQNQAEELCAVAAQELAHSFALDHVLDGGDPLTYFPFSGRRYYKDAMKCGSDCVSGTSPTGKSCTSTPNGLQAHACVCANGSSDQNDVQAMLSLFGAGTPAIPQVAIQSPAAGAKVHAGTHVEGTITADAAITQGEYLLDGTSIDVISAAPYIINLPATTTVGTHTLELAGTDVHGTKGTASTTFDVVEGGMLGDTCTGNGDCATSSCASDGTDKRCVQACDPTNNTCPDGFDCLAAGTGGVCWQSGGGSGGGGGCDTGGGGAGTLVFGLGFAALLFARRRS